jgi:L-lysine 2,3-aminomutase
VIGSFLEKLSRVNHVNFVRIGTRVPVVLPDRIEEDSDLIHLFRRYARKLKRLHVVTQFNHPGEITERSADAADILIHAGVVVLNQAILLRGVNDDPETLARLQSRLVGIGIGPYYVFQCRPVKRVKRRFQVPLKQGYDIVEGAKARLDGPSKRFRYVMSHKTGKIEIVAVKGDSIYLKYHQARDPARLGKFFRRKITSDAGWLDDLPRPAAARPDILPMTPRSAA